MINVTLFCRPESYKAASMDVYADNLFEKMCKLPDLCIKSFRPEGSHFPLIGKYLTLWLNYPAVAGDEQGDINHILDHSISHLISNLEVKKTIITCHDLVGLEVVESTPFWKRKIFWGNIIKNMLKARKIIVGSQHTKDDILKYISYKSEDIVVVYAGISKRFTRIEENRIQQRFKFSKPAILHVGNDNFYKNVECLIKAMALLDNKAILVKVGPISRKQFKLMKSLKIDFIQFMDLPEAELVEVYNAADILVYPSWHEGFGFPILEAMACGLPVVCSNAGSLPEVASGAAIVVAPDDISGIAKAIEKILGNKDIRQELEGKGFKQARNFSWERTAMETAEVYKRIA